MMFSKNLRSLTESTHNCLSNIQGNQYDVNVSKPSKNIEASPVYLLLKATFHTFPLKGRESPSINPIPLLCGSPLLKVHRP